MTERTDSVGAQVGFPLGELVPDDADEDEAAAIAAALSTYMAEASDEMDDESADPWTLAGRLRIRDRAGVPNSCRRGDEWKAAARYRR